MNRDQVRGILFGTAIGDALGMPVETFSRGQIMRMHGRIEHYLRPDSHQWFDGHEAGTTTDDTALTLATARALLSGRFDMNLIEQEHLKAFQAGEQGWGGSTRHAMNNLLRGIPREKSGVQPKTKGQGNGVSMKSAILGAYFRAVKNFDWLADYEDQKFRLPYDFLPQFEQMIHFAFLTHATPVAAASCAAMVTATIVCLDCGASGKAMNPQDLCRFAADMAGHTFRLSGIILRDRGIRVHGADLSFFTKRIREAYTLTFGRFSNLLKNDGAGWVANSLPLSFILFFQNPHSIEALYETIATGGDTDTNGAQVGALLGALNGMKVFPSHLVEGLQIREEIDRVADQFCDRFKIAG